MLFKKLLPSAFATGILAQNVPSLTEALASQNQTLSSLINLLASQPSLVESLGQAKNITILAPSNDALSAFLNNSANTALATSEPGFVAALLQYHVLEGTYYASNFTANSMFIPTLLTNQTYANITGGQVVEAVLKDDKVSFFSALKENSTVVSANVNFTSGTIHVIDRVLSVPLNLTTTARAANLTAVSGAIQAAGVGPAVSSLRDVTIFAPNNDAFNAIGNLTGSLSNEQLASILQYHVVQGTVAYSTKLSNTTIETIGGGNLTIRIIDGSVYVNSAKVTIPNVLISNGVVHVLDNVLNPANSSAMPDPNATSQPPAFSGAGPATTGGVPFTSGIPAPTTTAPVATSANPGTVGSTSTRSQLAPAMRTGVMGAAALFGGAAAVWNM